ncbi:hypothetical protein EMPG_17425 [Blastomyces silverae]|uniref:Uncharacterized protein n=1 Tax=Blastomyces silverae TaxID=2060906 RepID=A0A0H1BCW8_9EURO|nr:hypothetical protein EMPG_17425 [Blastomyces silverae]
MYIRPKDLFYRHVNSISPNQARWISSGRPIWHRLFQAFSVARRLVFLNSTNTSWKYLCPREVDC